MRFQDHWRQGQTREFEGIAKRQFISTHIPKEIVCFSQNPKTKALGIKKMAFPESLQSPASSIPSFLPSRRFFAFSGVQFWEMCCLSRTRKWRTWLSPDVLDLVVFAPRAGCPGDRGHCWWDAMLLLIGMSCSLWKRL